MNDYIEDLISQGLDESEALKRVEKKISLEHSTIQETDFIDKYTAYYQAIDPAEQETVGLYYGGFILLFFVIGSMIGFLSQGGITDFLSTGWIYTILCGVVGVLLGTASGILIPAHINYKKHF